MARGAVDVDVVFDSRVVPCTSRSVAPHKTDPVASRDRIDLHVARNPEHDSLTTAGCAYIDVADADALAAEWGEVADGRNVAPVDTDYGTREGARFDPDGNLIRFGSRR